MARGIPVDFGSDETILRHLQSGSTYRSADGSNQLILAAKRIFSAATKRETPLVRLQTASADASQTLIKSGLFCLFRHFPCEPCEDRPEPSQCARCLIWGKHNARQCKGQQRCIRCGGSHNVRDCKRDRAATPTCANCKGDHIALYKGCPAAKEERRKLNSNQLAQMPPPPPPPGRQVPLLAPLLTQPTPYVTPRTTTSYSHAVRQPSYSSRPAPATPAAVIPDPPPARRTVSPAAPAAPQQLDANAILAAIILAAQELNRIGSGGLDAAALGRIGGLLSTLLNINVNPAAVMHNLHSASPPASPRQSTHHGR